MSYTTINIIRNELKFKFQNPRREPFLTETHKDKRINFAINQLNSEIDWGKDVIISDESRFCLHSDSKRVWVKRALYNRGTFKQCQQFSKGIMVWGAIGLGWKSPLVVIKGTLNSKGYIDFLEHHKIIEKMNQKYGERNFHFQQDGAPPHKSKLTINRLEEQINLIKDWPPNSPDISCIENLWAILKARVSFREPETVKQLEEFLMEEWDKLDQNLIDSLIASTPKRLQYVIEERGGCIGHLLHRIKNDDEEIQLSQNPIQENRCFTTVIVVLPNQSRVYRNFYNEDPGQFVYDWISTQKCLHVDDIYCKNFVLVGTFGEPLQRDGTLEEMGFKKRILLRVEAE